MQHLTLNLKIFLHNFKVDKLIFYFPNMQSARILARSSFKQWRGLSRSAAVAQSAEVQSVPIETLTVPPPSNEERPVSPKIEKLVTEISQLNLIEVSELSGLLKRRLNLPDAPAFPIGGFAAAPAEEEEAAPQKVKSLFTVKLMKFDDKQKVALIKEMKNLLEGMNLVQAKKFVESAPTVVKADVSKDEADKLKEAIEKVGGTIVVE